MSSELLYLVTIGTGTAGKHSNLAQGVVNSIRLRRPSAVRLLPSTSPDSVAIAEMVIEELTGGTTPIPAIIAARLTSPDDLLACRCELRAVLRQLRAECPDAEIAINPTSGTKQMTAATVLACLDECLGNIEFIAGERADGVVKTGTERLAVVDARRLRAEAAVGDARVLLRHGDFAAAATLLADWRDVFPLTAAATATLAAWNRFAYRDALRAAAGHPELASMRQTLDRLAIAAEISLERAADLLNLAERELEFGRPEEALSAVYRAVELLAKLRLTEFGIPPGQYYADNLTHHPALKLEAHTVADLRHLQSRAGPDRHMFLGLDRCLSLLEGTDFALNRLPKPLVTILRARNETRFGHGGKCVPEADVARLLQSVRARAATQWPDLPRLQAAFRLPDLEPLIHEETDHA
jgi:hypothetical protein